MHKITSLTYFYLLLFPSLYLSQSHLDKYIVDEDGITGEKINPTKTYDENINANNTIYSVGRKFIFSYFYENTKGEKFLIKKGKDILQPEGYIISDWEFVDIQKQDSHTVNKLVLEVTPGNPFTTIPDYNQTAISYQYIMENGDPLTMETTGAIENEINVWIHPPRGNFFEILELNPFPYIKAPYKIGTNWNWNLTIGDHWSDKRWLEWKGEIENVYEYKIVGKKSIPTKLGDLECLIINAKAKSRIGETELLSYFNTAFGFVKLEYKNIDGTKTILELEKTE